MFDLVACVDKYPDFMPWCQSSQVQYIDEQNVLASININFHGICQSFSTYNRHHYPNSIELKLVEGPFSFLAGEWTFQDLSHKNCEISFSLEYTFSSRVVELLISPVFDYIASNFIHSFISRANFIYEKDEVSSSNVNSHY